MAANGDQTDMDKYCSMQMKHVGLHGNRPSEVRLQSLHRIFTELTRWLLRRLNRLYSSEYAVNTRTHFSRVGSSGIAFPVSATEIFSFFILYLLKRFFFF